MSGDAHGCFGHCLYNTNNIDEGVFHYRMAIALKADREPWWCHKLAVSLRLSDKVASLFAWHRES